MKRSIWFGMGIGSTIGGMIPSLWGADIFSFSSLFLGALGSVVGIFVAFHLTRE